jgi:hypothetical protein
MKRNFVIATLVALMLVTGLVITASAQTPQPTAPAGACANGWVDANNDGVCDNAPRDGSGQQYGMRSGQGQGMQGAGQGANFVDANNDGVCDNFGTVQGRQGTQGRGQGMGQGRGQGQGRGMGQGRGIQGGAWNNQG